VYICAHVCMRVLMCVFWDVCKGKCVCVQYIGVGRIV
jgi:hypothetical protein